MASVWCVTPEDAKVDLRYVAPDGTEHPFWIKMKKRLTIGEERRIGTAGWRSVRNAQTQEAPGQPGQPAPSRSEIQIDWQAQTFARAETWITAWSLTDDKEQPLALCRETIEALHPEVFGLIEDAITAHVEALAAAKKATPGASRPAAMSA